MADTDDDGGQCAKRLRIIADLLDRPISKFFGEDRESEQLVELLRLWDAIQTDEDREAVLALARSKPTRGRA